MYCFILLIYLFFQLDTVWNRIPFLSANRFPLWGTFFTTPQSPTFSCLISISHSIKLSLLVNSYSFVYLTLISCRWRASSSRLLTAWVTHDCTSIPGCKAHLHSQRGRRCLQDNSCSMEGGGRGTCNSYSETTGQAGGLVIIWLGLTARRQILGRRSCRVPCVTCGVAELSGFLQRNYWPDYPSFSFQQGC